MTRKMLIGLMVIILVIGAFALSGHGQRTNAFPVQGDQKNSSPTSNQLLMKDKLTFVNKALDGLVVEDFDKIAKSAEMMRMISRAASWHVLDSDEYNHISKNFQEQAADLERSMASRKKRGL
jgi:hypothetical protein